MALINVVPGVYVGTWNATAMGETTSEGYALRYRPSKKRIENTQTYGDTLIDGIFRGMVGVQVVVTLKEWTAAIRSLLWPWGNTATPAFDGIAGQVGLLDSASVAKQIVLTAASGSPAAAANSPATITLPLCVLSDSNDLRILMGPDERDIPIIFDVLPSVVSSVTRFFTIT